jgi:hypothetical protein
VVAGGHPDKDSGAHREQGGDHPHQQRDPGAVDDAYEQIPPEVVGTQQESAAGTHRETGGREPGVAELRVRSVAHDMGDHGGAERDERQHEDHHRRGDRDRVATQPPCRQPQRTETLDPMGRDRRRARRGDSGCRGDDRGVHGSATGK